MTICYRCKAYDAQTSICTVTGRIEDVKTCDSYLAVPEEGTAAPAVEEEQAQAVAVDLSHLKDDPNEIKILLSNYDPKKTSVFDCRAYFEKYDSFTFEKDLKEVLRQKEDL